MTLHNLKKAIASLVCPRPARDWLLVLALVSTILIIEVSYTAYLYISIRSNTIIGIVGTEPALPLSVTKDTLENIRAIYQARADQFESGNFTLPILNDPFR